MFFYCHESKKAFREKATAVVADLRAMKLKEAAKKVEALIGILRANYADAIEQIRLDDPLE